MRSSKSRSRSKNNRSRSMGNIVNRVFDSSGPEGKVRGTPQQIIDKYNQLARDAQLGNDPVAAENFQQHAEHYTRLLGVAQREQDARREQQEAQKDRDQRDRQPRDQSHQNSDQQPKSTNTDEAPVAPDDKAAEVMAVEGDTDTQSTLVETPEAKEDAPRKRAPRAKKPATSTRKKKPAEDQAATPAPDAEAPAAE